MVWLTDGAALGSGAMAWTCEMSAGSRLYSGSTALTVTYRFWPANHVLGVPFLPAGAAVLPGAAVSPGSSTCRRSAAAGRMTTAGEVEVARPAALSVAQ